MNSVKHINRQLPVLNSQIQHGRQAFSSYSVTFAFRHQPALYNYPVTRARPGRQHIVRFISPSSSLRPTLISRQISISSPAKMSDQDYMAFLNKANQDYSGQSTKPSASEEGISSKAHKAIRSLGERYYSSDSDEPFVDVTFDWDQDNLPAEAQFGDLVGAGEPSKMAIKEWDPTSSYKDVVSAVKEAAGGAEPAVYRTEGEGARATYYVLALNKANKQLLGVKALAVES